MKINNVSAFLLGMLVSLVIAMVMVSGKANAADYETLSEQEIADITGEQHEPASAKETSCQASSCDNLTKEQEDCVVRKRCNKEIRKMLKKQRALEEENEELREQLAAEQAKNEMLKTEVDLEERIRRSYENKPEESSKKNSVSLLVGRTGTGVNVSENSGKFKAESDVEDDVGLMYQRDFGKKKRYRGSLGLTVRGNGYLGIGVNF